MSLLLLLFACAPKPVTVAPPVSPTEPAPESAWSATPDPAATTSAVASPSVATDTTLQQSIADAAALLTTDNKLNAEAALSRLQALAQANPSNAVVQYNLGLAYYQLDRRNDARTAWTEATRKDPKLVKAWLNLGALSMQEDRPEAALSSYESGIKNAPDNIDLRVAAIAALRKLKRYDDAIAQGKAALAINSNAVPIYTNIAMVYLDTGKYDLAAFILRKATEEVAGAEGNANLWAVLGEVYYRKGFEVDARMAFEKALTLDPQQFGALMFFSAYYLDNRDYTAALPLLERAAKLAPTDPSVQLRLGIAYRGMGRYEQAKAAYDEALRLNPQSPEPYRNLAVLYGDYMKSYDAAMDALERYRQAGGGPADELDKWKKDLEKAKKKAEDQKRKEEEARQKAAQPPPAPEPAPVEIVPVEPAPSVPAPAEPAPSVPVPAEPAPAEPAPAPESPPVDPAPGEANPWGGG